MISSSDIPDDSNFTIIWAFSIWNKNNILMQKKLWSLELCTSKFYVYANSLVYGLPRMRLTKLLDVLSIPVSTRENIMPHLAT